MATHGTRHARTPWVGWVYFAAAILFAAGIIQFVNGIVALARPGATFVAPSGATVSVGYGTVGGSFLIAGIVLAVVACGVLTGRAPVAGDLAG